MTKQGTKMMVSRERLGRRTTSVNLQLIVLQAIDNAAADDRRSRSGLLNKILSEWLREKGYLK